MQVVLIIATMFFGSVFLGVKAIEYTDKYNHGTIPVDGWNKKTPKGEKTEEHTALVLPLESKVSAAETTETKSTEEHHYVNPHGEFQIR